MELEDPTNPKPSSEEDSLTAELRREFALLNKIFELRKIGRDTSKKKLNRKAAKAAIKRAKESDKKKHSLKAPKIPKPAPSPKKKVREWLKKICWRCNTTFFVLSTWDNPPSLCAACAKDLDETYVPSSDDRSTPFTKVHFVSGGAPGLGKRR